MKKTIKSLLAASLLCSVIVITTQAEARDPRAIYDAQFQAQHTGTWTMLLNECGYPDNDVRARFTALLDKSYFTKEEAATILVSYENGVKGDGKFSPRQCTAQNLEGIHKGVEKLLETFQKQHVTP